MIFYTPQIRSFSGWWMNLFRRFVPPCSSSAVKEDPFQIQGQAKNEHRKKKKSKIYEKSQGGVFSSSGMAVKNRFPHVT